MPQTAEPGPIVTASRPAVETIPARVSPVVEERRAALPASADEPSIAWVVWSIAAAVLLFVVLAAINSNPEEVSASSGSDYQPVDNRRSTDSIAVLALASADSTLAPERLVTLESTLHANGFTVSHDAAHARYSRIMLDSADALIGKGLTFQARGMLGTIGDSARPYRFRAGNPA